MIGVAQSIPEAIVREHIAKLCGQMRERDIAATIVFDASNMLAFTGTPHMSWDRLTCGVVTREGDVRVVCPAFERPGVCGADKIASIHTWQEHQNPYDIFASAMRVAGISCGAVGVDGRIWLSAWHRFADACGDKIKLQSAEEMIREVRICKSPLEQDALRGAHRRGERAFLAMKSIIRGGASEIELQRELAEKLAPEGITITPMVQSGPNGAIPHNPTGDRKLQQGDTVVMDSVTPFDGYFNDITRTYAVGEPSDRAKKAYRAVREAQQAAIDAAKPGVECQQLDKIARGIITEAGFGEFFTHRLGHGLGIEVHEPPFLVGGNSEKLRAGMCVTIEPGVYVPGEFGIRIEDDILITDNGCEVIRGELTTDVTDAFD